MQKKLLGNGENAKLTDKIDLSGVKLMPHLPDSKVLISPKRSMEVLVHGGSVCKLILQTLIEFAQVSKSKNLSSIQCPWNMTETCARESVRGTVKKFKGCRAGEINMGGLMFYCQ